MSVANIERVLRRLAHQAKIEGDLKKELEEEKGKMKRLLREQTAFDYSTYREGMIHTLAIIFCALFILWSRIWIVFIYSMRDIVSIFLTEEARNDPCHTRVVVSYLPWLGELFPKITQIC